MGQCFEDTALPELSTRSSKRGLSKILGRTYKRFQLSAAFGTQTHHFPIAMMAIFIAMIILRFWEPRMFTCLMGSDRSERWKGLRNPWISNVTSLSGGEPCVLGRKFAPFSLQSNGWKELLCSSSNRHFQPQGSRRTRVSGLKGKELQKRQNMCYSFYI